MIEIKKEIRKGRYWFTADYHWGHHNVLSLCDRPFNNIDEHDFAIRDNHNAVVSENDTTYNLGDIGYRCNPDHVANGLESLKGKIVVILGNHDKPFRQAYEMGYLNKMLNSGKLEIIGGETSIKDHSLYIAKTIEINGQRIFVSHLAHRTWPSAFRNCWHLFGHSHTNLKPDPFYKSFDVGVDGHNFYPWSFEDVKIKMDAITTEFSENPNPLL
jgi:calcineurin-like phosphoesterase family protein